MPTLVATPGASNANSYVTLAEYVAWLDARLNTPANVNPEDQERALIMATWRIDAESFQGTPSRPLNGSGASPTQALQFPRWGLVAPGGWHYDHEVIPEPVKRATMELAIRIEKDGTRDFFADPDADLQGVEKYSELKVDVLTLKPRLRKAGGELPNVVLDLLAPLMQSGRGRFSMARG